MNFDKVLAAVVFVGGSQVARAESAPTCIGFFNSSERAVKLEGARLEPSGPMVAAGTELEFNGIGRIGDKLYLTRARSAELFDSANVEVTSGCDLPTRDLATARQ